ncbi:unnamed protein product [Bursaphelenchus xylophilus]|uniref:(pine wood nematode) hypothetical protein n=1 Tax=Bursaphelenchus xylophilus TaxID=6326 RepID=A0A1I7RX88_BURXY|nr:unnamed protein product [Bursaphelenchus xylophilus]CAG9121431.1 unnamed protein product [Bursaphelenchus xylophilus]
METGQSGRSEHGDERVDENVLTNFIPTTSAEPEATTNPSQLASEPQVSGESSTTGQSNSLPLDSFTQNQPTSSSQAEEKREDEGVKESEQNERKETDVNPDQEKKRDMDSRSNSDSPHSLLIDEDEPGTISRVATEEPTNESAAYQNDEEMQSTDPAPPLEANQPVDERENPYSDVLKDPLLGQLPSNEVLQLLEQQSAEEKRLRDQQEEKEREEQQRVRQEQAASSAAQINGHLNGLAPQVSQALNGLTSQAQSLNGLTSQAHTLNGLTSQAQLLNGLTGQPQAFNGLTSQALATQALNGLVSQANLNGISSQANGQNGQAQALNGLNSQASQALNGLAALNGLELPFNLFGAGHLPLHLQSLQFAAQQAAASSMADNKLSGIGITPNLLQANVPQIGGTNIPSSISAALAPNSATDILSVCKPEQHQLTGKRKEIYKWEGRDQLFAMAWSYKKYPDQRLRLACSTIKDKNNLFKNSMSIIEYDEEIGELVTTCNVYIGTPSCELHFIPDPDHTKPDLIASATKELRIYSYHPDKKEVVLEAKMLSNRTATYMGPLTSVDWNEVNPALIATSSIDSTCTVWDVEAQKAIVEVPPKFNEPSDRLKYSMRTQMIAHDRPVHDIEFCKHNGGLHNFATCSADGSARLFDLRDMKTSQIIFEDGSGLPVNHIAFNKIEPTQFAVVQQASSEVIVGDHRMPTRILQRFTKHGSPINSVDWAPHTSIHLCTGSSDRQALIWQVHHENEPILAYPGGGEITKIRWSGAYSNWIAIAFNNKIELLRV